MTHVADILDFDQQVVDSMAVMTAGRPRLLHTDARLCRSCGERRPRFSYRGVVKSDRNHNLCFECFRAETNRLRARRMAGAFRWVPLVSPMPPASKMVGDRTGLRQDLQLRLRRAQIAARIALDAREVEQQTESLELVS